MNETICHKARPDLNLSKCELVVDENDNEKPLDCCMPVDRIDCFDYNLLIEEEPTVFAPMHKKAKTCPGGKTWSFRARRCIKTSG